MCSAAQKAGFPKGRRRRWAVPKRAGRQGGVNYFLGVAAGGGAGLFAGVEAGALLGVLAGAVC